MILAIGTISHGTLRQQDLLRSFSDAYELYCRDNNDFVYSLYTDARAYASLLDTAEADFIKGDYDIVGEILDQLTVRLEALAAEYGCYFGTIEGDGSDFGFWPNETGPYAFGIKLSELNG